MSVSGMCLGTRGHLYTRPCELLGGQGEAVETLRGHEDLLCLVDTLPRGSFWCTLGSEAGTQPPWPCWAGAPAGSEPGSLHEVLPCSHPL